MSTVNVNSIGQINQAGDTKALFLKKFAGEVGGAFIQNTIMMDKSIVKSSKGAKSLQFPIVGQVTSDVYTAGSEIVGDNMNFAEQVISAKSKVVSSIFLDEVDAATSHYDVAPEITKQMGAELANRMDKNIIKTVIKAARSANPVTGLPGGSVIVDANLNNADIEVKGQAIKEAIFNAGVALDEKNAPKNDRYCILRPAEYAALAQFKDVIDVDYDGMGSISQGTVKLVNGIKVLSSNNLENIDSTATDTEYGLDASNTYGIVFTKDATGTAKLFDIQTESEYLIKNQGSLMVAKYVCGHGVLRPECAVELSIA
jgi:hypothetical protein